MIFHLKHVFVAALSLAAITGFVTPSRAIEMTAGISALYESVSIYPPSGSSMTVCYGFVCRRRAEFEFTAADKKALEAIMAKGKASAAAERAAVQSAVVWWDKRLGPVLGTTTRVPRADFRHNADKSNYDCWDTTRNITSLLLLLQDWGYLRHHTVADPRYRGNVLVLQTPHNTPVIKERAGGGEWAVDMWTVGYAQPPQVMTVAQWMTED
ncbi:hypothetical protein [Bradyrhizobium sp. LHD-71]|uniref:hypothetical protein n=1 Tax=Bradyrhizobium sp. LHD-71 TaxID=3072141 RepID=UPI00280C4974|nr:hypothetical protein [Bradyrhizobium sp. LHD-71]MDQ8732709.1 hypothetical protein [Bradyrhizobium sp. LHD-71]